MNTNEKETITKELYAMTFQMNLWLLNNHLSNTINNIFKTGTNIVSNPYFKKHFKSIMYTTFQMNFILSMIVINIMSN
jgi:hypothetical protein